MADPDAEEELDALGGPLRHIPRKAPPWSSQTKTACGREQSDVKLVLSWDDAAKLAKKVGYKRAQFLFCQTCLSQQRNAEKPSSWLENPLAVVHDWTRHYWSGHRDERTWPVIRAELLAIARLVEYHREEFDALVASILGSDLDARRKEKRQR